MLYVPDIWEVSEHIHFNGVRKHVIVKTGNSFIISSLPHTHTPYTYIYIIYIYISSLIHITYLSSTRERGRQIGGKRKEIGWNKNQIIHMWRNHVLISHSSSYMHTWGTYSTHLLNYKVFLLSSSHNTHIYAHLYRDIKDDIFPKEISMVYWHWTR